MPQLREINSTVSIAGPVGGRAATGTDYGAQTGAEIGQMARPLNELAFAMKAAEDRNDMRTANVTVAGLRSKWTVRLREQAQMLESQIYEGAATTANVGVGSELGIDDRTQPASTGIYTVQGEGAEGGKETRKAASLGYAQFATAFSASMDDDLVKARNELTTDAGRAHFDERASLLREEFRDRAFLSQADLAGKQAKADTKALLEASRNVVMDDPSQMAAVMDDVVAAIGKSEVPASMRAELEVTAKADIAKSAVQGMIRKDPYAAFDQLTNGTFDSYLDGDVKNALVNTSVRAIERKEAKALADEKAADKANAKQKAAEQEEAFKKLYSRLPEFGGDLTLDEVMKSSDSLDTSGYKTLLDKFSSERGGGEQRDPDTYIALRTAAGNGHDVRPKAAQAYRMRKITREDMDRVFSEVEANSPRAAGDSWWKAGRQHISDALTPSPLTATGFERQNLANAKDEWDEWSRKNPDATPEKARAMADAITARYAIINYNEIVLTLPTPYGSVKPRKEVDDAEIGAAFKRLEQDRRDGIITEEQYRKEAERLRVWSDHIRKIEQYKEQQKPKANK